MLIISSIKEIPTTKSLAISRAIYLIPGMICAAILAGSGVNIDMQTSDITINTNQTIAEFTINGTTGSLITNSTTTMSTNSTTAQADYIVLQNPVWVLVHFMIFAVLGVYVVNQALMLLTKKD